MDKKTICHFTGLETEDPIYVGPFIAGLDVRYVMANTEEAKAARKYSRRCFDEDEANCNTCKFLQRTKHDKRVDGRLLGICQLSGQPIKFHPDDPMHMDCYVPRWKDDGNE